MDEEERLRKRIQQLILDILSDNPKTGKKAAVELSKLANTHHKTYEISNITPALIDLLNDVRHFVKINAVLALGEIKDLRAAPALIEALKRCYESKLITYFNYVDFLLASRNDQMTSVVRIFDLQKNINKALIGKGVRAVPALIDALESSNEEINANILSIIIEIGKPAVPELIKTVSEKNDETSLWATSALKAIKDPSAVPVLIDKLKSPMIQIEAALALGEINDPRALPALVEAFESKPEDARAKVSIMESLGKIGDKSAVSLLLQALKDTDKDVRWNAAKSLGEIEDNGAIIDLINALADTDQDVRDWAFQSLEHMIQCSKTVEEIQDFESKLQDRYERIKKKHKKEDFTNVQMRIAKVKMAIAKKKNELAEDKGVLLDDKPKPPKKEMYQQIRRLRNG